MKTITERDIERFMNKVEKSEGCWGWTSSISKKGYALFYLHGGTRGAHRVSYEIEHGPISEGMHIDHICHNRACTNPQHLRLVTNKQNSENLAGPYKSNTSGVIGVYWSKSRQRWVAEVTHHERKHFVGRFKDIEQAHAAVVAKRLELFTHNDRDHAS